MLERDMPSSHRLGHQVERSGEVTLGDPSSNKRWRNKMKSEMWCAALQTAWLGLMLEWLMVKVVKYPLWIVQNIYSDCLRTSIFTINKYTFRKSSLFLCLCLSLSKNTGDVTHYTHVGQMKTRPPRKSPHSTELSFRSLTLSQPCGLFGKGIETKER